MLEIAIAVAVIAFALVAIVGLLPLGMETQRDNRQETIINHDGAYLLEVIRGRATNMYDLANFVDALLTNDVQQPLSNSVNIIRTLSVVNRKNAAIMRPISGALVGRAINMNVRDFTMHYEVVSQIFPATNNDLTVSYGSQLASSLYEIRLTFYWPVAPDWRNRLANGQDVLPDAPHRHVFRTIVSGQGNDDGFLNASQFGPP